MAAETRLSADLRLDEEVVERLVSIIDTKWPGWTGFDDDRYLAEERNYKMETARKAQDRLSAAELERLIARADFDEVVDRVKEIGQDNNLLFKAVGKQGDLGPLYYDLDREAFAHELLGFLHGDGPSPARLKRFGDWLEGQGLPSKWAFTTYFLFFLRPETDLFVKPEATTAFAKEIGLDEKFWGAPAADQYARLLEVANRLRELLSDYGPRDMVDIQGFMWCVVQFKKEVRTQPDAAFTPTTFELLQELHREPTREFYNSKKEAFKEHVEEPFKALFLAVVERLNPKIDEVMETERWLFSQIPKNDYGRGGAWEFYWGAIYPSEAKRTTGPQLFLSIHRTLMELGFSLGQGAKEYRDRFLRNAREHQGRLGGLIGDDLRRHGLEFGGPDGEPSDPSAGREVSLEEFLADPAEYGIKASLKMARDELLSTPADELADRIAPLLEDLFPFVLLAISDDPMPAIADYLGLEDEETENNPELPLATIAEQTGFHLDLLRRWTAAIHRKKQAILYGPPGTGKTFIAEKLADHLVGGGDGLKELVQFHPAYSYEEFMQGIRPDVSAEGDLVYRMVAGRFKEFCARAARRQGTSVLIIDEINRANLSRVFGELMYLLEYRDRHVHLAGGEKFRVPPQVRLLGTMNTADRSIALVDHALRRRFAFLYLKPDFGILRHYHRRHDTGFDPDGLIAELRRLNATIADPHYEVGISFFLRQDIAEQLADVWRMEIEPYLEEYFFDQPDKVEQHRWEAVGGRILA